VSVLQRLAGSAAVRHLADLGFDRFARRRTRWLEYADPVAMQQRTLLNLVRRGTATRFGIDHQFDRIRSIPDYQARVPLRDYDTFWRDYWQPAFPRLTDVTWPGLIPYFGLSSGTTSGTTKYIPISWEMIRSNRRAALTTLAWFLRAHPKTPLFRGRMFFLGGSTDLTKLADDVLGGDLSGIATREVSSVLRPYTFPPLELALIRDWEQKMQALAEQSVSLPITLVSGVPSWMLVLFERIRKITARATLAEVWPTLGLVIHGGTKFDPYRALFREIVGGDVKFQEVYPASEGYIAGEDSRHGLLRLLPDCDIFYEFVPVEDLGKDRPVRHTLGEIVPGLQYAVVMTTCAGLWSYVLGDTICFERRNPPLLRFTGRTNYFLSAFGEHLISEEVERAVTLAADATKTTVTDFHVGPMFPEHPNTPGRHLYLIEFVNPPSDLDCFTRELDAALCRINEDYAAHRSGDLTMLPPEVCIVPRGGFAEWMRSKGKLGGQHKVPRMDNSGQITGEMSRRFV
jgi:hypothetical protein